MSGSNGHPAFVVDVTGSARSQLRAILRHGRYGARRMEVARAFERVIAKLKETPRTSGDPLYHMRKMKMVIHHLVDRPLYFEYGVHDEQPVVVIRWIALL